MTLAQFAEIEGEMRQLEVLANIATAAELPNAPSKANPFHAVGSSNESITDFAVDIDAPVEPEVELPPPNWGALSERYEGR